MIVRWPESFLRHRPPFQKHVSEFHRTYQTNNFSQYTRLTTRQKSPWWKNDKVCNCCSFFSAWTGQHSEDTGDVFSWDFNWIFVFFRSGITLGHCGQSWRCSQHRSWQDCTGEIIKVENVPRRKRRLLNLLSLYYTNLVRSIVPMPGNNVKRRVVLFCLEKMPLTI